MSGRWKGEKQLQVQQRGRPMPFTEEQMRQIYNTNIIDFAVRNGFEIEKSDKATVHVKHNGGLYLFKHGRGYYSFTEERGGDIVEFAMNYLGLKKREAMEQILGCRACLLFYPVFPVPDEGIGNHDPADWDAYGVCGASG